jgi:7,8-dihydro-6-hydroxymethylpterin-pyrophosphokinase
MKIQHIIYVSLGTNKGNKFKNLQNAIDLIADEVGTIQKNIFRL